MFTTNINPFGDHAEQLTDVQRLTADHASQVIQNSLTSAMRLAELQMENVKQSFGQGIGFLNRISNVKSGKDALDLQDKFYRTQTGAMLDQSRKVTDVIFDAQERMESLTKENYSRMNKTLNRTIDKSLAAVNVSNSFPGTLFRNYVEMQRDAFERALGLTQKNWEQGVSQARKSTRNVVDQIQKATVNGSSAKKSKA